MKPNFMNTVKVDTPNSNIFDLTHDVKLSTDMGKLTPICLIEAIPGDKFKISCESLLRFAPMLAPMMHRVDVFMHYFFVPNRILWPQWEQYITGGQPGEPVPAHPFLKFGAGETGANVLSGDLADYLGIPLTQEPALGGGGVDNPLNVNALPFAAYQKIYDDYFRDQNLINPIPYQLIDGDNSGEQNLFDLRYRAWEHDLFTASLPFSQKGPAVDIPIGGFNDVPVYRKSGVGITNPVTVATNAESFQINSAAPSPAGITTDGHLFADTSTLEQFSTTINDLRQAMRLQEWLEKNARGGSRYIETILVHFGVQSDDARLQRAEYITGSKTPVQVSEVLNTTGTDIAPQGDMAGHGVAYTEDNYHDGYYCKEHGWIVGIMSVMPKTAYQQGIPKHFLRINDKTEYFWSSFANLGEQPVTNQELMAFGGNQTGTFGYMPMYYDYRYQPNRVAGDFRTTLAFWHLGRIFSATPALNQDFIQCDADKRIFAVTDVDQQTLWCHVLNKITCSRKIPFFGTPTF